ncbi:unnamed protein product, partial [Rotaria sp. Silwood1]
IPLEEYRQQREAKKKANQLLLLKFKTQDTGKVQNTKVWKDPGQTYSSANNDNESEDEDEETECEESLENEQLKDKKNLISIPLVFKPFEYEIPCEQGINSTRSRDSGVSRQGFYHNGGNRPTLTNSNRDSHGTSH